MKTVLLFDIDKTLTPPRLPITKDMVNILCNLLVPFHVVAGSHLNLLREQFFIPLFRYGFRKKFDASVSNGAISYLCDYSEEMSIKEVSRFDIHSHLGEPDYSFLIETLEKALESQKFKLPQSLKVVGETVTYRISMVNFCPIGRVEVEGPNVRKNRANFVRFDKKTGYRSKMMDHLRAELGRLIKERDLVITLGGETSFDIGILGQDKTKALRILINAGIKKVIFFGDALFEGGNDYAIREYIENQHENLRENASYYQVDSYKETIKRLYEFGFVQRGNSKLINKTDEYS